jgi:hypothetical protein
MRTGLGLPGQAVASTGCPAWVAERDSALCEEVDRAGRESSAFYYYLITEKPFASLAWGLTFV